MFRLAFEDLMSRKDRSIVEVTRRVYVAMYSFDIEGANREIRLACRGEETFKVYPNFMDPCGRTLLHLAVMVRHLGLVKTLRTTALINFQDARGYTALHYAMMTYDNMDIIRELLAQGIDVNIQSAQGYTAYDIVEAVWQASCNQLREELGHRSFTKLFLEKVEKLFEKGVSEEEIQKLPKENPEIAQLLKEHMTLENVLEKKFFMEQNKFKREKTVDFSTFLMPYFIYFGLPDADHVYWYRVPKELPSSETASLNNKNEGSSKEHEVSKKSSLALSDLRTASNADSVNDNSEESKESKESSSMATSRLPEMQHTLEPSESLGLAEETLSSLAPSQVSPRSGFFEVGAEAEEEFSEYSLISSSTTTSTLCTPKVRRGI